MLNPVIRLSRSLALPLTAVCLAFTSLAGCGDAGPGDTAIEEDPVTNVQIRAEDIAKLAPGERLSVDLRPSRVMYHVVFAEELDFTRIDLAFGDGAKASMAEAMAPLFSHPYSPLQATSKRFVLTSDPANFDELTPADIDALEQERMIAREHGSGAPKAQPQSVDECVEQTIYFYVDIEINGTVRSVLCAHTILVCGGTACDVHNRNGHEYLFCDGQQSWNDARASCASQGKSLLTLNDAEEEAWIYGIASVLSTQKWWMGLNDRSAEGSFVWQSGEPVSYTNWYSWEPNDAGGDEDCGQLNRFYPERGWNDEPCSLHLRFICESN